MPPQADGSFQKIPQLGNVVLEDDVEIGANCTLDRATMGSTIIKAGAKLDNLIQVGHNAIIGENTVIAAQAGISGTTRIGKNNMIGGQAGIVGHISTAAGVKIQAQSGVGKTVSEENKSISGTPADEYRNTLKSQVIFRKLPEMAKKNRSFREEIARIEKSRLNSRLKNYRMYQENQHTLKGDVSISGVGLHTGEHVNMTLKPAPAGAGIRF